nr:MAG TPA: hypothetical protein [Caudoviricetes sp.]DAP81664.1 MAG TPA: hypothetical protein [Caudoviricetes sp.]DAY68921.1 MAG TPA: hypothetical protein [Caudoviricetes sp.]
MSCLNHLSQVNYSCYPIIQCKYIHLSAKILF